MKKLLTIALLFVGLIFVTSSCKSDYDKYLEIRRNAFNSSITELETPEGFRFDMSEDQWNESLNHLNPKDFNYKTYYEWQLGTNKYAGYIYTVKFYEEKLCYYEIWIEGKFYKDKLLSLASNDIENIVSYYKDTIEDESDYMCSSEIDFSFKTYVWAKENMMLKLLCPLQSGYPLMIQCINYPVWASIVKNNNTSSTYSSPTTTPSVIVKNNKWNGGVKQVEDYLERTLRAPDSYESIEWSEVKQKDDGFYVRHKYRAKNGFGGYVVTNQLFHLDFSGNVVDVKDLY